MGQVGSAGDNAAMESFFALLQKNVLDRQRWATRDELRIAIVTWIERTYHRRRRQAALGRLTPIEYETIMTTTATRRPDPTCHLLVQQTRRPQSEEVHAAFRTRSGALSLAASMVRPAARAAGASRFSERCGPVSTSLSGREAPQSASAKAVAAARASASCCDLDSPVIVSSPGAGLCWPETKASARSSPPWARQRETLVVQWLPPRASAMARHSQPACASPVARTETPALADQGRDPSPARGRPRSAQS